MFKDDVPGSERETTVAGLGEFDRGWVIEIPYPELSEGIACRRGNRAFTGEFVSLRETRTLKGMMPTIRYTVVALSLGQKPWGKRDTLMYGDLPADYPVRVVRRYVAQEFFKPGRGRKKPPQLPPEIVWRSESE